MTLWVVLASVAVYLVGFRSVYKYKYLKKVEQIYQSQIDCRDCKEYLDNYRKNWGRERLCYYHDKKWGSERPEWVVPLFFTALAWPAVGVLKVVKWIARKSFFPRGVKTPAQTDWKLMLQAAQIERNEVIIKEQQKKINLEERV